MKKILYKCKIKYEIVSYSSMGIKQVNGLKRKTIYVESKSELSSDEIMEEIKNQIGFYDSCSGVGHLSLISVTR